MKLNTAIILSWGIIYIASSLLCPEIGLGGFPILFAIGVVMVLSLLIEKLYPKASNIIFLFLGISEAFGAVASWSGVIKWNIGQPNPQSYQISMAFMDFVASVAFFSKVEEKSCHQ